MDVCSPTGIIIRPFYCIQPATVNNINRRRKRVEVMIVEIVGYVVLLLVILSLIVDRYLDKRNERVVRDSLLDRIMSRDYDQYADVKVKINTAAAKAKTPVEVVTIDELDRRSLEHETGIPI